MNRRPHPPIRPESLRAEWAICRPPRLTTIRVGRPVPAAFGRRTLRRTAPQPGPYEDLDPQARRNEWSGAFGDPTPGVPQQAGPQYGQQHPAPDFGAGSGSAFGDSAFGDSAFVYLGGDAPSGFPAAHPSAPDAGAGHEAPAQGEWGETPDWPPKSSQAWMAQQSQTGWGLTNGGAAWPGASSGPPEAAQEAPADLPFRAEPGATPYGASTSAPRFDPPAYEAPQQPGQEAGGGSLEFPELRSDPYEADVYGQAQYRGDSGGQDLYQSDPYQAERLQAEAQQAREEYQAQQYQADPFPPAPPQQQVPQQGSYGEPPVGQPGLAGQAAQQGAPAAYGADPYAADPTFQPEAPSDPYFGQAAQAAPGTQQDPYFGEQPSYEDPSRAEQPYGESAYADQGQGFEGQQGYQSQQGQAFPEQPQAHPDHPGQGYQDQAAAATLAPDAVPAQRGGEESATPAVQAEPASRETRVSPPTHRGVRYAIYGIGGLITLGLIIGIVIMLGAAPPEEPGQQGNDDSQGDTSTESPGADEALSPERYGELAAAAGTAEWFSWRYGEAGENGAEELAQAGGDAVATEPLLDGAADRSIQGQLGYVTDESGLSGIDHVTAVETTDELIGLAPRAGGKFTEDGAPELELQEGATAECLAGLGGELGKPVALARPEQSEEVNAHSVIAFSSGIIATAGISGAQGGTCLQLPAGQVPTDVALTDGNELALVTTWTPESQSGSLVVIALGDTQGSYQSSWSEPYPGLPNAGHFAAAEILGTVTLPFTAPTSVDAWSNSSGSLSVQRSTIADGAGRDNVATAGYAIIGDLSSSQASVVDLPRRSRASPPSTTTGPSSSSTRPPVDATDFDGRRRRCGRDRGRLGRGDQRRRRARARRPLKETAATEVGANPTCLVVGAQSGAFIATSRGEAKISWVPAARSRRSSPTRA